VQHLLVFEKSSLFIIYSLVSDIFTKTYSFSWHGLMKLIFYKPVVETTHYLNRPSLKDQHT